MKISSETDQTCPYSRAAINAEELRYAELMLYIRDLYRSAKGHPESDDKELQDMLGKCYDSSREVVIELKI